MDHVNDAIMAEFNSRLHYQGNNPLPGKVKALKNGRHDSGFREFVSPHHKPLPLVFKSMCRSVRPRNLSSNDTRHRWKPPVSANLLGRATHYRGTFRRGLVCKTRRIIVTSRALVEMELW